MAGKDQDAPSMQSSADSQVHHGILSTRANRMGHGTSMRSWCFVIWEASLPARQRVVTRMQE
jgi:hypothetical protein